MSLRQAKMFERTRLKLLTFMEILDIPNRVLRLEKQMANLRESYDNMVSAVAEVEGELRTLASRLTAAEANAGDSEAVAVDMNTLADRLRAAYPDTPPA